jgi:hypothetical protein
MSYGQGGPPFRTNGTPSINAEALLDDQFSQYVTVRPPSTAPFGLLRPASDTGLQTGNFNMIGDYSTVNKEFYVEALAGERLAIRRAIVHIYVDGNDISPGTYGNIPELTNGIILFQEISGIIFNVLDGLPLKKQEDWGRISYDSIPVGPYGPTSKTPFWQVRLTFTKFVDPTWGIILEEGDRLGLRISDDLSVGDSMLEHYIYFEGQHLGIPSAEWQNPIDPLP